VCVYMCVCVSPAFWQWNGVHPPPRSKRREPGGGFSPTYSFCASMMTRTLSLVDAVDGGTPMSSRKLLAMVAEDETKFDVPSIFMFLRGSNSPFESALWALKGTERRQALHICLWKFSGR
jgi:hypothetical protein